MECTASLPILPFPIFKDSFTQRTCGEGKHEGIRSCISRLVYETQMCTRQQQVAASQLSVHLHCPSKAAKADGMRAIHGQPLPTLTILSSSVGLAAAGAAGLCGAFFFTLIAGALLVACSKECFEIKEPTCMDTPDMVAFPPYPSSRSTSQVVSYRVAHDETSQHLQKRINHCDCYARHPLLLLLLCRKQLSWKQAVTVCHHITLCYSRPIQGTFRGRSS